MNGVLGVLLILGAVLWAPLTMAGVVWFMGRSYRDDPDGPPAGVPGFLVVGWALAALSALISAAMIGAVLGWF